MSWTIYRDAILTGLCEDDAERMFEHDPVGFGTALAICEARGWIRRHDSDPMAVTAAGVDESMRLGREENPCPICRGSTIPILWSVGGDAVVVLWVCLEHDDALLLSSDDGDGERDAGSDTAVAEVDLLMDVTGVVNSARGRLTSSVTCGPAFC